MMPVAASPRALTAIARLASRRSFVSSRSLGQRKGNGRVPQPGGLVHPPRMTVCRYRQQTAPA